MARAPEPERAHRTAAVAAEAGAPVRRLRRLLRHLGQPAGGAGGAGADPPRRRGQSRGNGRADRRRAVRPAERARPRNRGAFPAHGRALQGARRLARVHRGGESLRRKQVPRSLQHRAQVDRGGAKTGPGRASRPRHRLRRADARAGVLLHGQPRQRPGEHRRSGRGRKQHDLLRHRQRLDHQLSVRADDQDRHHLAALPAAGGGHGRRRRCLPGRHPDGRARRRTLRAHPGGRLRAAVARGTGRTLAGLHMAQLAAAGQVEPRDPAGRPVTQRRTAPHRHRDTPGYPLQGGRPRGWIHRHRPRRPRAANQSLRRPDFPPDRGTAQRARRRRRKGDHPVRQPRAHRRMRGHRLRHRGDLRPAPSSATSPIRWSASDC